MCLTCQSHWSRVSHILIVSHVDCVHVTCSRVVSHVCYMSATSHMSRVCRVTRAIHVTVTCVVLVMSHVFHVLVTCHVSCLSPCLLLVLFRAHVSYMFLSHVSCVTHPSHFDNVSVMCWLCVGNVSDMFLTCQLRVYVFHTSSTSRVFYMCPMCCTFLITLVLHVFQFSNVSHVSPVSHMSFVSCHLITHHICLFSRVIHVFVTSHMLLISSHVFCYVCHI